ncbi:MAG: hypothetical protein PHQ64_04200 [Bacilli bacterium]|nr:hypothetical protein [Bacilli bacterium]
MSFYPIDELEKGNYSFLYDMTIYDKKSLIKSIRSKDNKNKIISAFIKNIIEKMPYFSFDLIYDNDNFQEEIIYLINKYNLYKDIDLEKLKSFINTSFGRKYILDNLSYFIIERKEFTDFIIDYSQNDIEKNRDFIDKLYLHSNLSIRAKFMKKLIDDHIDKLELIYDDITKYFTSYTHQEYEQLTFLPELMDVTDISEIAIKLFEKNNDKKYYEKLKEIILNSYKENDLARFLIKDKKNYINSSVYSLKENKIGIKEFSNDANTLFSTSRTSKLIIMNNFSEYITKELMDEFKRYINLFTKDNKYSHILDNIYYYGLGNKLQQYVEKYLEISKSKESYFIASGSCSHCFKIGDYVIKLANGKWSYEEELCPNLYLILKNIEEEFIRNDKGVILTGFEIQKYLTKRVEDATVPSYKNFLRKLNELGYYYNDDLLNGKTGDNCMILDSYMDADHPNPEELPVEFKENPIVLVDRDLIFKKGNEYSKKILNSTFY